MPETSSTNTSTQNPLDTFDHVVVLMLENRSFDNLLGNLYQPKDLPPGKIFAGLHFDGPHCNPVPKDSKDSHAGKDIGPTRSTGYHQPYPDPGEFYAHVNTQLYGTFNPPSNEGQEDGAIVAPYNRPDVVPIVPPMNGFVADYLSVLKGLKKKSGCLTAIFNFLRLNPKWFKLNNKFEDYKAIMECFEPDQIPVMTKLAKEFAVFDHWFCDVPSQTYTNRAFWHAGTAFGNVNNSPLSNWILEKNGPTLFNRLEKNSISWKVYSDNPISLTAIIHRYALEEYFFSHFKCFTRFLEDTESGDLPAYSFIEPRFFTPHNDQHPSSYDSALYAASEVGAVWLGERLIWEVYDAIRKSKYWKNTLLIITHDEHGGCFDHIPPSPATVPSPENPPVPPGKDQPDFKFDRLGIRVPMIMVSAYIKPNTIVNNDYRHTSFLKTMCTKWGIDSFTNRDAAAPVFTEVFTADAPRAWPEMPAPTIPSSLHEIDFSDTPLSELQKAMLVSVAHLKGSSLSEVEALTTTKEAMQYLASHKDLPGAAMEELTYLWKLD